ncbi:hypothetical protein PENFLA_c014G10646 [Penicillium flavigenum]|uniref:Methyltransferase domain-containing protein n=1 Tax=Penicillium flavigenum TaxID=254877 RepID=A0A1V6T540_9EURO|nr:hypothetical protein PENFLA_c014G10646 [Penicillium flavigenum]
MKICVINSSTNDDGQAPNFDFYIPSVRHQFFTKYVTDLKASVQDQVGKICEEGFDAFMNNLSNTGANEDEVTEYLESKGLLCITNNWAIQKKTELHLQEAAGQCELKVLQESLNHNKCDRFAVILIEMGHEVVPLAPVRYATTDTDLQNGGICARRNQSGIVVDSSIHEFVEDEARKSELQSSAIKLFKALKMTGVGWLRVDFTVQRDSNQAAISGVSSPDILAPTSDHATIDDFVIQQKFPGGHEVLIDTLIAAKEIQCGVHVEMAKGVSAFYDKMAPSYNSSLHISGLYQLQRSMAAKFDFSGQVLDVGCGRGSFGEILNAQGVSPQLTGIEISKGMIDSPSIESYYQDPIRIGLMQELVMNAGEFDHIVCFSAFQFLNRQQFSAVLARMFMLARKSITFEVDDLDDEYLSILGKLNGGRVFDFNNAPSAKEFGIPRGWRRVHWERLHLYTSPTTKTDVFAYAVRFERADSHC